MCVCMVFPQGGDVEKEKERVVRLLKVLFFFSASKFLLGLCNMLKSYFYHKNGFIRRFFFKAGSNFVILVDYVIYLMTD